MKSKRLQIEQRYRTIIPGLAALALLAVYLSGADAQQAFGKSFEDAVQAAGITLAALGALGRFTVSGWADASRERAGPYSVMRHPLTIADFMILTGLAVSTQVWWFAVIAASAFAWRMNAARKSEPLGGPSFLPNPALWRTPSSSFSWRRGVRHSFGAVYLIVLCTVLIEIGVDLRTGHATLASWPADWAGYFLALAIATGLYPVVRGLCGDRATVSAGPATRGLRVDGRAGVVDTLENLISGGQQEAILAATLEAANIGGGEKLLDVGCGTGKLAIAAERLTGPDGTVTGIDATPAMIDLARDRARNAGSGADFRIGVVEHLPFADGELHAVTSSYFFHHLPSDVKAEALREMWRVLAPGGRLVITDYGKPQSLLGYVASIPMQFDLHEYVRPQLRGELDDLIADMQLGEPELVASFLGYINVVRIVKRK